MALWDKLFGKKKARTSLNAPAPGMRLWEVPSAVRAIHFSLDTVELLQENYLLRNTPEDISSYEPLELSKLWLDKISKYSPAQQRSLLLDCLGSATHRLKGGNLSGRVAANFALNIIRDNYPLEIVSSETYNINGLIEHFMLGCHFANWIVPVCERVSSDSNKYLGFAKKIHTTQEYYLDIISPSDKRPAGKALGPEAKARIIAALNCAKSENEDVKSFGLMVLESIKKKNYLVSIDIKDVSDIALWDQFISRTDYF